ncbi:MAG: hypothetical protein IKV94_00805 [Clostridia bacterium]|nr:hypothetical protein [Clostridia bacterium]
MTYLLVFMYLFAFKIYSIFDSALLVGAILFGIYCFKEEFRKKVNKDLLNKYSIRVFICFGIIAAISALMTLINGTFDFTYIKTLLHLAIAIFIGYVLIIYFWYRGKKSEIVNHIIVAFIVQSFLQWFFFLFPTISQFFNFLRSESMVKYNIIYSGYRGLAITTSGFFSLSSAYGLVFLLFFSKYNTLFKNVIVKYFVFLLLLSGTFFAGRTGFVALAFLPFMWIRKGGLIILKQRKKQVIQILLCTFILIAAVFASSKIEKFGHMYNYAFELFENIFKGNGLKTTSTDKLLDMFDVDMSAKTFFVGDGKYTEIINGQESYYKKTDVGYFRKILYFGIFGLIASIVLQLLFFGKLKKDKELILVLIYLFVLELKGEIVGFNIMINSIIILYSSFNNAPEYNLLEGENVAVNNCVDDNI